MSTILQVYGPTGAFLGVLPDYANLKEQIVKNDTGVVTFTYPRDGLNANQLVTTDDRFIEVVVNGVPHPQWFLVDDDEDDDAAPEGKRQDLNITARGTLSLFQRAIVYPQDHAPGIGLSGKEPIHEFKNSTPGEIIKTLINKVNARTGLTQVPVSFTTAVDSAGAVWPKRYSVSYPMGQDYLTTLQSMCEDGWIDMRMHHLTLDVYAAGGQLAADKPNVILKAGQNVQSAPRKRTRRGLSTTMLAAGDQKWQLEVNSPAGYARYGRREGFISDARFTGADPLIAMGTAQLKIAAETKEGFTVTLLGDAPAGAEGATWAKAGTDFTIGNTIRYDARRLSDTLLEPLQVESITWAYPDGSSEPTVALELAYRFVPQTIRTAATVKAVTGGSLPGPAPKPVPVPIDKIAPKKPSTPTLAYTVTATKRPTTAVKISWDAVTEDEDDRTCTDLASYPVSWRINGDDWTADVLAGPSTLSVVVPGIVPGDSFQARVAARDRVGNTSAYATGNAVTVPGDRTPPPQPSKPILSTRLGTVTIRWDGYDKDGAAMPVDFDLIEIHAGPSATFVETRSNLVGTLAAANEKVVLTDLPYNTDFWFSFVAVDTSTNLSPASDHVVTRVVPLVDTDIIGKILSGSMFGDKSIDTEQLADGSVQASQIDSNAVTLGKIAVDAVGADQIAANAIVAGKIAAAAVVAGNIAALAVEAGALAANAVTADTIEAGAIRAVAIAAGAITTDKLALGTLKSNPVPDPGFEEPYAMGDRGALGWHVVSSGQVAIKQNGEIPRSGGSAMKIIAPGAMANVAVDSGVFPVVAGTTVRVSAYVSRGASAIRTTLRLVTGVDAASVTTSNVLDGPTEAVPVVTTGVYQRVSGDLVIPAGQTYAAVRIFGGGLANGGALYVDDVSVVAQGSGGASELTAAGLRIFDDSGDEVAAVMSGRPATFTVTSGGVTLGGVDAMGNLTGAGLSTLAEPTFAGDTLTQWIEGNGARLVQRRIYTSGTAFNPSITTARGTGVVGARLDNNRLYRVFIKPPDVYADSADAVIEARVVAQYDGGYPTVGSSAVAATTVGITKANAYHSPPPLDFQIRGQGRIVNFNLIMSRAYGTGNCFAYADGGARKMEMRIYDEGGTTGDVWVADDAAGSTSGSPTQSVTSVWNSTGSYSYRDSGAARSPQDGRVYQGFYSSSQGNQSGAWFFGGGAVSGETGKTIASALAGATSVDKVEVYLVNQRWYENAGGLVRLSLHNSVGVATSRPGTWVNTADIDGWATGAGKWVDLTGFNPAGWKNLYRGFGIGQGPSTDRHYYGYFAGSGAKVRITYQT